jgi:hypothetical protein
MSDPKGMIGGTDEPDAEVELTAQDLRELSESREHNERDCDPMKTPAQPPKATAAVQNGQALQIAAEPARARHVPVSRLSLSLAPAVGAIGALYLLIASSDEASQPVTQDLLEHAPQSQAPESRPEPEPHVAGKPVQFANPFDAHEVFEFPAGTSEAEARDTVAQVLMARAMERQRHFDGLVSKND